MQKIDADALVKSLVGQIDALISIAEPDDEVAKMIVRNKKVCAEFVAMTMVESERFAAGDYTIGDVASILSSFVGSMLVNCLLRGHTNEKGEPANFDEVHAFLHQFLNAFDHAMHTYLKAEFADSLHKSSALIEVPRKDVADA